MKRVDPDQSLWRKVLAAFGLIAVSIIVSVSIAKFSFQEIGSTVGVLTSPNEKLTLLNRLFEKITTLDQSQRQQAILSPQQPQQSYFDQSLEIIGLIDSIKMITWDSTQLHQLDRIENILAQRDYHFLSYLKIKAKVLQNRSFAVQLDTLTDILRADELTFDSTMVKAQKTTTTSYINDSTKDEKDGRSFIRKLFSKRKKATTLDTPKIKIQQEVEVLVDTLALAKQTQAVKQIEDIMKQMEKDQRSQRIKLQQQELELVNINSQFTAQLLGIVHDVQQEELIRMRAANDHARDVMTSSLNRFHWLMGGGFVIAAFLIYLIWIDVSRSNFYKNQLIKARDEAEELGQIKQRFLANMSHELRTPLQSIIGFAELLREKNSAQSEEVNAIHSSSEHLLQIVNEVLDYSRISSGKFKLVNESFDLIESIKEVESAIRIQADKKNIELQVRLPEEKTLTVEGDNFRIRQILYNLLGNAVKFTSHGSVKLNVSTQQSKHDQITAIFEISDTGIGISEAQLEKIFNQFEQADPSISKIYGGTGLGLTIVKSLVTSMKGDIQISSAIGEGSTFTVELPLKISNPLESTVHLTTQEQALQVGKILMVDDDSLILRLCSLILQKNNIDYVTRADADNLVSEKPIQGVSHIFLDIRMPKINGIDLCKALRKVYPSTTKFIALTAHVLPEEQQALLEIGFDAVLPKPFHERDLLTILQSHPVKPVLLLPDFESLKKMTMGDEGLFLSILSQFIDETSEDVLQLKTMTSSESDAKPIREIVHKMAGRFAQMGIYDHASTFQGFEKRLVQKENLDLLMKEILPSLEKVKELLNEMRVQLLHQV